MSSTTSLDPYSAFHAPRFHLLLGLLARYLSSEVTRVCDVGPSPLTEMLREHLTGRVDSIGLQDTREGSASSHFQVDLLAPQPLPDHVGAYDAIVFGEVLEHLRTPPVYTLNYLHDLLHPDGLLFLQTPNAVSLPKRLKMLMGRNPYELLRESELDPGHIREYTRAELHGFLADSGFEVLHTYCGFYFDARFAYSRRPNSAVADLIARTKNMLYPRLPESCREGISIVARRVDPET